jgi:hypothetical protein
MSTEIKSMMLLLFDNYENRRITLLLLLNVSGIDEKRRERRTMNAKGERSGVVIEWLAEMCSRPMPSFAAHTHTHASSSPSTVFMCCPIFTLYTLGFRVTARRRSHTHNVFITGHCESSLLCNEHSVSCFLVTCSTI